MIFERAFPSPEQLQSRPHGTLSSPLRVHEQRHMSSAGAPEPADLRFRLVFLWFSFKDEVQKEAPKSDFFLSTRTRQREEREGQSQPEEPRETEEGDAQTEAPERPQSRISILLRVKEDRKRKEGVRASQRSPEETKRQGETQGKSRRRSPRAG